MDADRARVCLTRLRAQAELCKKAAGLAALIGKLQNAMEEISIGSLDDEVRRPPAPLDSLLRRPHTGS